MNAPNPSPTLQFKSVTYQGLEPGARLMVTGAVHGNETCGTQAIQRIMAELDSGALTIQRGTVTFVPITNPLAYVKRDRAGDRNLNRNLGPVENPADFEDRIANWLCPLLARHDVLLDLHSTRARSQPFAMLGPRDNDGPIEPFKHSARERALAKQLGVRRFVEGWLGTYAKGVERRVEEGRGSKLNTDSRYGVGTTEYMRSVGGYAVTLECGQHEDPESPGVAYRAIRNTLAFLGMTPSPALPQGDGGTTWEGLKLREVIDRNHEGDRFGRVCSCFDRLAKVDLFATRHVGTELRAPHDGWIMFPDAKAQPGHEWFYLAEDNPGIV
jgi:predicted deacylase